VSDQPFAVGIDLGTTNTVIAYSRDGEIGLVPSAEGHTLHPSVVASLPSGKVVVGLKARLRRIVDPENTVFSAKRLIGQPFSSHSVQNRIKGLPYSVVAGENDECMVITRSGREAVTDISAHVLRHAKEVSEAHLGHAVTHCVVTVPAHFTDGQRAATREAAERAGFTVLRVFNEPTAAALAYGLDRALDQKIVVFDMGGGTFDASILSIRHNVFEVIATGGDPYLGGDDMDELLGQELIRGFVREHNVDGVYDRHAAAKTLIAAEQIKMHLSEVDAKQGTVSEFDYCPGGVPLDLHFDITRLQFEQLISPLIARALFKTEQVLGDANLQPTLIDDVLMVGGATRVPAVHRRVREFFGKPPRTEVNPMHAVAIGAAIQAGSLMRDPADVVDAAPLLMDVTGHGLGLATVRDYTDFLIEKNTAIPVDRTHVFTTGQDGQTSVRIQVCQGDSKTFGENHPLGVLHLDGLTPAPRGQTRIEVSFLLDADGILRVRAKDATSGKSQEASLRVHGANTVRKAGE